MFILFCYILVVLCSDGAGGDNALLCEGHLTKLKKLAPGKCQQLAWYKTLYDLSVSDAREQIINSVKKGEPCFLCADDFASASAEAPEEGHKALAHIVKATRDVAGTASVDAVESLMRSYRAIGRRLLPHQEPFFMDWNNILCHHQDAALKLMLLPLCEKDIFSNVKLFMQVKGEAAGVCWRYDPESDLSAFAFVKNALPKIWPQISTLAKMRIPHTKGKERLIFDGVDVRLAGKVTSYSAWNQSLAKQIDFCDERFGGLSALYSFKAGAPLDEGKGISQMLTPAPLKMEEVLTVDFQMISDWYGYLLFLKTQEVGMQVQRALVEKRIEQFRSDMKEWIKDADVQIKIESAARDLDSIKTEAQLIFANGGTKSVSEVVDLCSSFFCRQLQYCLDRELFMKAKDVLSAVKRLPEHTMMVCQSLGTSHRFHAALNRLRRNQLQSWVDLTDNDMAMLGSDRKQTSLRVDTSLSVDESGDSGAPTPMTPVSMSFSESSERSKSAGLSTDSGIGGLAAVGICSDRKVSFAKVSDIACDNKHSTLRKELSRADQTSGKETTVPEYRSRGGLLDVNKLAMFGGGEIKPRTRAHSRKKVALSKK